MEDNIGMLEKEVSAILLREWDPLGVADFAEARTEYEAYAVEIISMYQNGNISAEKIFDYLKSATEKSLNLKPDEESIATTTRNLVELFNGEIIKS